MDDLNTLVLAVAAILFVTALVALTVWAFRTYVSGRPNQHGFLRPRDKRLGVIETASVDARRKLLLRAARRRRTSGHDRRSGRYADRDRH